MKSKTNKSLAPLPFKCLSLGSLVLIAQVAAAAENDPLQVMMTAAEAGPQPVADAIKLVILLTALALVPGIIIAMTSFTRTIIVLSMLRHAFGMPDTPPNLVLVSLSLFLTVFTMAPAFQQVYERGVVPLAADKIDIPKAVEEGVAPLRGFMVRQTRERDLELVLGIGHAPIPNSIEEVQTIHLIPAFLISELKTAFQIGFVIFLPFLLLDLVVASILMSMGMLMVPPTVISLPIKILMFVVIDGWELVIRALLGSFR